MHLQLIQRERQSGREKERECAPLATCCGGNVAGNMCLRFWGPNQMRVKGMLGEGGKGEERREESKRGGERKE